MKADEILEMAYPKRYVEQIITGLADPLNEHLIKLVGFDQDLMPPIRTGDMDSVVMERTYDMGRIAMEVMDGQIHNRTVPGMSVVPPMLMTRENIDSPEIRQQLTADWWVTQ